MFEGATGTVLALFLSSGIAAVVGALSAQPGRSRNILWGMAGAFFLSAAAWVLAPSAGPIAEGARSITATVVQSNGFVIIVVVSLVALMLTSRAKISIVRVGGAQGLRRAPSFADLTSECLWTPDILLSEAYDYLAREVRWRRNGVNMTKRDVESTLVNSLHRGKISGWAKVHPTATDEHLVQSDEWAAAEVDIDTNYAFFRRCKTAGHGIRVSRGELEAAFPPT